LTAAAATLGKGRVAAPALPACYLPLTTVAFAVGMELAARTDASSVDTVIVGGGQAGLALSRLLTDARHDHVLLERGRVGERWRKESWDSLALLTPNWANRLPHDDEPADPDGYDSGSGFVARLERYARSFGAPVREHTTVTAVDRVPGGLRVRTDRGEWRARSVVLASGDCAVPVVPPFATAASADVEQLHSSRYRAPDRLAPGGVLVVGSGPSGHQIAHELARTGRDVVFAVGRHARIVRRYRGRDIWSWLRALGDLSRSLDEHRHDPRTRVRPALPLDGRQGGRTIDLGVLAGAGVRIAGRLDGFAGAHALFGSALEANVTDADERLHRLLRRIDEHIGARADPRAFPPAETIAPIRVPAAPLAIDLAADGISTIIWATGYRRDYPWLHVPHVVGSDGGILHDRGRTVVPGLFVLGTRWQYRMTSHQIGGVGADAAFLAERICTGAAATAARIAA
jgi:putative flavoprotein involved in K+ transport